MGREHGIGHFGPVRASDGCAVTNHCAILGTFFPVSQRLSACLVLHVLFSRATVESLACFGSCAVRRKLKLGEVRSSWDPSSQWRKECTNVEGLPLRNGRMWNEEWTNVE